MEKNSFNPSVGILFVHTDVDQAAWPLWCGFQSLGRDSVCSYLSDEALLGVAAPGFNPSVGILFVHTSPSRWMR